MARTVSVQPTSFVLKIKLSGGTSTFPTVVKALNRSTNQFVEVLSTSNDVAINLADLSSDGKRSGTFSGFSNGDIIEVKAHGRRIGSTTYAVSTGKGGSALVTVTVIDLSSTEAPELNA